MRPPPKEEMESAQDQREANVFRLAAADKEILLQLARFYIWWKTPEEAIEFPQMVMAQVMKYGVYEDVKKLVKNSE